MNLLSIPRPNASALRSLAVASGAVLTAIILSTPGAQAQDAGKILKTMTDYVTSQKNITVTFDTDIEVITNDLQKIQFASSGQMLLSRPDKIRVSRTGGYADVEMVFDGKTFTVLGKNLNKFTQMDSSGSIDDLVGKLRNELGVAVPGADLLLSKSYDDLMADVIDAKDIGRGVIDGVECES
jgi:hypothetical protein